MTCILARPDLQTIFDYVKNAFSANVLGGGKVVPDTNEWYACSNDALAHQVYYSTAEQMWKETDPRYACGDNLQKIAAFYGVYPRPASFARGYVKISGIVGSRLVATMAVQFGESIYRTDPTSTPVPAEMPEAGYIVVRVVADVAGDGGNGLATSGTSGRLVTPLDGVSNAVEIYGGQMCAGRAAETIEEFRWRFLFRMSHAHRANLSATIRDDLLAYPCVTRFMSRDCECCTERGRLDLFIFMDGTFQYGIPPQSTLDVMTDWYFGKRQGFGEGLADVGQEGRFYAAKAVPVALTISNLPCASPGQIQDIRDRVTTMIGALSPGQELCRRMIDACVIQVLGYVCHFDVVLSVAGRTLADPTSFVPACDELPVIGTLKTLGGSLTT